jgi:hypothetical protein
MIYRDRKDNPFIFCNELNYIFQNRYTCFLFRYQNVAGKSRRNDSATTYAAGDRENGQ